MITNWCHIFHDYPRRYALVTPAWLDAFRPDFHEDLNAEVQVGTG